MDILEIGAEIQYDRALPYHLPADCTQIVRAFVDGSLPQDRELAGLEEFRRAVLGVLKEALTQTHTCSMDRYVGVHLSAGEHGNDPVHDAWFSVEAEGQNGGTVWILRFSRQNEKAHIAFSPSLEVILDFIKELLNLETGTWATEVTFP